MLCLYVVEWRCRLSVPRQKKWREFLQRKEWYPPRIVSVKRVRVKHVKTTLSAYGLPTQVLATAMVGVNFSMKWNILY